MKLDKFTLKLISGKNLSFQESQGLFTELFRQKLTTSQAKNVLLLLAKKGESVDEILGCLQALQKLEPQIPSRIPNLLDTCGTGADQSHSINVSTLAALVIAGAGGKVAKHGNRGITSKCGSSDLLEALGVKLKVSSKKIIASIQKNGIGYLHAPEHHPVFLKIQPLRRSLKTRTIFNLLGPLINPLTPSCQLIGVSNTETFDRYVAVLKKRKADALVCQGMDGLDEITLGAPTKVAILQKGQLRLGWIRPENFGMRKSDLKNIRGGNPKQNAAISLKILKGELKGPARDIVILNAAAGLVLCGVSDSITEGIHTAIRSIDSGKAYNALQGLVRDSQ